MWGFPLEAEDNDGGAEGWGHPERVEPIDMGPDEMGSEGLWSQGPWGLMSNHIKPHKARTPSAYSSLQNDYVWGSSNLTLCHL